MVPRELVFCRLCRSQTPTLTTRPATTNPQRARENGSGENEYLMRSVMRLISYLGAGIAPVAPTCLQARFGRGGAAIVPLALRGAS